MSKKSLKTDLAKIDRMKDILPPDAASRAGRSRADEAEQAITRTIAARLRAARQLKGLSQTQLGARRGVSFQQIQKYESGSNTISAAKLRLFADDLGVGVDYFYDNPRRTAPRFLSFGKKFPYLVRGLQTIQQRRPLVFAAICNIVASLARQTPNLRK